MPESPDSDRSHAVMSSAISRADGPSAQHRDERTAGLARAQDDSEAGEKVGLYARHGWLVPATVVAAVIGSFVLMFLVTWLAGGTLPFGD